jgi:hypothetical protein
VKFQNECVQTGGGVKRVFNTFHNNIHFISLAPILGPHSELDKISQFMLTLVASVSICFYSYKGSTESPALLKETRSTRSAHYVCMPMLLVQTLHYFVLASIFYITM